MDADLTVLRDEIERHRAMAAMLLDTPKKRAWIASADALERLAQTIAVMTQTKNVPPLSITYRNWRGEVATRAIIPDKLWYGATEWHPDPQWLLRAHDVDKGADRDFAIRDMFPSEDHGTQQMRVAGWMLECFGQEISRDKLERNDRFFEEAIELVQSTGYSPERAHALVDYVFGRPAGEPGQEVGGVTVTLAALCNAHGIIVLDEMRREIDRITTPEMIAKIRAKQAAKPTGSALPVAVATSQTKEA